jgi:hypothetical protein
VYPQCAVEKCILNSSMYTPGSGVSRGRFYEGACACEHSIWASQWPRRSATEHRAPNSERPPPTLAVLIFLLLIVLGKRLYSKAGTQIYVPGRACVRTYVRVSEFTSLCTIRVRWYCALLSNGSEARHEARESHRKDHLEVSHVPATAVARDATSKDAAVVIKMTHTPLAHRAVVDVFVLYVVAEGTADSTRSSPVSPNATANAVYVAIGGVDIVHSRERLARAQTLEHRRGYWEATLTAAFEDAGVTKDDTEQAEQRDSALDVQAQEAGCGRIEWFAGCWPLPAATEAQSVRNANEQGDEDKHHRDSCARLRAHHGCVWAWQWREVLEPKTVCIFVVVTQMLDSSHRQGLPRCRGHHQHRPSTPAPAAASTRCTPARRPIFSFYSKAGFLASFSSVSEPHMFTSRL